MMRRLKFALTAALLLCATIIGLAFAQSTELDTYAVAVALYDNGSYVESEALFQQLVDEGYRSGRLYHNLASAQHKQRKYGAAILNYRRALELSPRSLDTRSNLDDARERVVDQLNRSDIGLFETLTQFSNWLTLTEIAGIALALWLCWGAVWLRYRHPKSERQRTAMQSALIGLSVLLVVFVLAGSSRAYRESTRPALVVVVEELPVLDAPGATEPLFVLHDGAEVQAVDRRGEWVKLTLPGDSLQGWVSAETVAYIKPESP